jgi:gliding motility-associated-like protein
MMNLRNLHKFDNVKNIIILLICTIAYQAYSQCPAGTGVSGLELVMNGNFEQGNTAFTSQYTYCNTANCLNPESRYTVASNPNFYHSAFNGTDHTTGSGNFMIINGAGTPNTSVWCQTITVTPNTQYLFSTWVCSVVANSPALLQFSINGNSLGPIFSAPNSTFQWLPFNATWNSGSNTTATICIINQNTNLGGNDFGLDDISFQPCTCNYQAPALNSQTICPGDSVTVDATGIATDYLWFPANGVSCSSCPVATFSPSSTTPYLLVSSINNCFDTTNLLIAVAMPALADAGADVSVCAGAEVQLAGSGNGTYQWSPAVGLSSSTISNPTLNPTVITTYTLTVTTATGCTASDEVVVNVFPGFNLNTSSGTTICIGQSIALSASGADSYSWIPESSLQNPQSPNPQASPTLNTTYTVTATDNDGCTASATVVVNVFPQTLNASVDTLICKGESLILYAPAGSDFEWVYQQQVISTAGTANANTIIGGTHTLNYSDENGCNASKQYNILINNDCDFVQLPNAFTPNGDGKNDIFRIIGVGVKSYNLKIFNRWGQLLYETNDTNSGWNGTINGTDAEMGTYVYVLQAELQNGNQVTKYGNVSLLR